MRSSRRSRKTIAEMNVVPYIDVMLVLLIIFMVTVPLLQSGVEINLPQADANPLSSDNQQEPLIISVDQTGQYSLSDGSLIDEAALIPYIREQIGNQTSRPVYLRADASIEYQYLMTAMTALQKAGVAKIGLMADPSPTRDP